MGILAHRGYWEKEQEKNTFIAFERAFNQGFGVEMDLRYHNSELVVSHDLVNNTDNCLSFHKVLDLYKTKQSNSTIAINIKADGLQLKLKKLLSSYDIQNYFVFDMSVPDQLHYHKNGFSVFTRQSEYEKEPVLYKESEGVWLDEFSKEWIDEEVIKHHLSKNKKIAIVSPELHNKSYLDRWQEYKDILRSLDIKDTIQFFLCTDYPTKAKEFF